jgi:hypothetical protein
VLPVEEFEVEADPGGQLGQVGRRDAHDRSDRDLVASQLRERSVGAHALPPSIVGRW